MRTYHLPYGKKTLEFALPDGLDVDHLTPHHTPAAPDPQSAVQEALDTVNWTQYKGARTAAIAINDKTRPVRHDLLLPPLLARLEQIGISRERITLIVATGSHPPMMPTEFYDILPVDIVDNYKVISHDVAADHNIVRLGFSTRRTLVSTNRMYFEANLKIVVGNVEPHQFSGFSGGVKSAVIGLAGMETINGNHKMMAEPHADLGRYEDNPVRQDIEDMGRIIGINLALNSVINDKKEIVKVFCGTPSLVMKQAIPWVRQVYEMNISEPYDMIIASPGGYPKDINIYQAQKALGHASLAVREGGAIILAAACSEGAGSAKYEQWLSELRLRPGDDPHQTVIDRFKREGFRVGPHKAFQISRDSVNRRVIWITDLHNPSAYLFQTAPSLHAAITYALEADPSIRRVGVLPYANSTIIAVK